ncbi:MAG: PAS domain-containing sensor histidine kinase [Halobacteriota archaeon]|nr:PAS domain-containing sensor histidine kinase [Halobacteriota archaeon]
MIDESKTKAQLIEELTKLREKAENFDAKDEVGRFPGLIDAMDASMDGMAIADQNDEYIYLNEVHAKIYGYDNPNELISKSWKALYNEELIEEIEDKIREELERNGLWRGELVGMKRDGSEFFQELSLTLLEGSEIICAVRDITERKESERALRESEEKYRKIVELSNDAIIIVQDGRLKFGNAKARDLFGYSIEDIGEIDFLDHIRSEFKEVVKERYLDRMAGKDSSDKFEIDAIRRDGENLFLEVNAIRIDYKGGPADFIFLKDITDKKNVEKDLRDSKNKMERAYYDLKELDRLKTEFAAIATHEIGTPLSVVKSNIEMLLDESFGVITDIQRERLQVVFRNIEYLVKLNKEMMDISRIDAGRLKLKKESCHVHEMVRKTAKEIKSLASDKDLKITVKIDENIPVISCDGNRVRQVLDNLLNNAIKFTPGSGDIRMNVGCDENVVMISVSDNGIGIPEEEHIKIFERFYEVGDYLSHETGGAGLGLAIVKGIVEAHGGKVWVESSLGSGSTFYFTLPR